MTSANAVREFLMTRRAKVQPEDVGLPRSARRRVPGLRREEVAALAGVSVEYYVQVERGHLSGVSDEVLSAIARALVLDEAETGHLFDLARADVRPASRIGRSGPGRVTISPALEGLLDAVVGAAAVIQDGRLNILASNPVGAYLFSDVLRTPMHRSNTARYLFFDDRAREFYEDWDSIADDGVSMLQVQAGRTPRDRGLTELVGELATRSQEFRKRWARHDVKLHDHGSKRLVHPEVGALVLQYQRLEVPGPAGLTMFVYTALPSEPRSRDGLALLASLAATESPSEVSVGLGATGPTRRP